MGDTGGISSVTSASTSITMPESDAEITAAYVSTGPTVVLMVDWGDSAGNNDYDFSDWDDVVLGLYTSYTSDGPDGIAGGWTGTGASGGVYGSSETFYEGDQIVVTWYNAGGSSFTFTPKISFDDPDRYGGGTSGTWYDMSETVCAASGSATSTYTFTSGTAGSYSVVNVCRYTNNGASTLMDKIEIEY